MSRSMFNAADVPIVAQGETVRFDPPGPCQYTVSRDDQGLWQAEEFVDRSGELVYRDAVPVNYAVGSGRRGWSFLTDRGGLLTQGVATWYSTRGVWDLSPGFAPSKHARFSRRVSDGCVTCHAGHTNSIPAEPNRFGKPAFAELSIGCERCHGPGKDHVNLREAAIIPTDPDPIVNPSSLGYAEQLSVCYQCHLHGEKRIVRSGRSEFDFRPGERISDVWVTFVNGSGVREDATTAAVSQVEQMHVSRCFTESGNRMSCTTCHDPHRLPGPEERVEFYRTRCLSCHDEQDTSCRVVESERLRQVSNDSCIECHMPSLSANDVPHTAQTDHRVIRFREAAGSRQVQGPSAILDLTLFPVPDSEQRRARGLLLANRAENGNDMTAASAAILLLSPLADDRSTDVVVLDALASCYDHVGDHNSAHRILLKAIQLAPRNERVLHGLAVNSKLRGSLEDSLRYLNRVHVLYPSDGTVMFQIASLLNQLKRPSEAYEACQKAVLLMPHDLNVRTALISLAKATGAANVAEEQQRLVDRMKESLAADPAAPINQTPGDN